MMFKDRIFRVETFDHASGTFSHFCYHLMRNKITNQYKTVSTKVRLQPSKVARFHRYLRFGPFFHDSFTPLKR